MSSPDRQSSTWTLIVASFCLGLALAGCGDKTCVDLDGDGLGDGCAAPDCDDTNPLRTDNCDTVAPPDCDTNPFATGCPCILSATSACYSGPDGSQLLGECQPGVVRCRNGHFGLCEGEVVPTFETCDGLDQSCDGRIDDGVRSPCGGCDPMCVGGVWGEGEFPFVATDGLALTGPGFLTLDRLERTYEDIWIANTDEDTVTRIDAALGAAIARHPSGGSSPSRVAVDWRGDVFVLNREFGGTSTMSKIASDLARCIDRDLSTTIETSPDADTALPLADDECVLFTVPIGEPGDLARAIAVDGARVSLEGANIGGNVWVGMNGGEAILHLDGDTGAELQRIETPGFRPYGATYDAWGTLTMISQDGLVLRTLGFDPADYTLTPAPLSCFEMYGIAADRDGRLVIGGFSCDQALLFDPTFDTWRRLPTLPSVRSVAITGDTAWLAHTDGRATEIGLDPLVRRREVDLHAAGETPIETIGVTADSLGAVWFSSSQRSPGAALGLATRVDVSSGDVVGHVPLGARPHSQGDGSGARLTGEFVETATTTQVFTGCTNATTEWQEVLLSALPGGSGSVEVAIRHAATEAELGAVTFVVLGTRDVETDPFPVALDLPEGGVIEVRLTLATTARDGAPRVERLGVRWGCGGLG